MYSWILAGLAIISRDNIAIYEWTDTRNKYNLKEWRFHERDKDDYAKGHVPWLRSVFATVGAIPGKILFLYCNSKNYTFIHCWGLPAFHNLRVSLCRYKNNQPNP
jgi:hypothetical protein